MKFELIVLMSFVYIETPYKLKQIIEKNNHEVKVDLLENSLSAGNHANMYLH